MIERQRIMLDFISRGRGKLSRTQLMKWLFLLKEETTVGRSTSFYEFVPYKYGPFSFLAYKELATLCSAGIVHESSLSVAQDALQQVRTETDKLSAKVKTAIGKILIHYGSTSREQLVEEVYRRYPWYTVRSEIDIRAEIPKAKKAVFTIGYEGRSVDGMLDQLLKNGVLQLIDVRKNALSRKYGFSGKTLRKHCESVGIKYVHLPDLGIPSSLRTDLDSEEAYQKLFDKYEHDILPIADDGIQEAAQLSGDLPSALMCFEKDPHFCHRGRLVNYVAEAAGLPVEHI